MDEVTRRYDYEDRYMPRPKRPFSDNVEIVLMEENDRRLAFERLPKAEQAARRKAPRLVYRVKNGYQDPITVLLVLDVLLDMRTDIEIRSQRLAGFLNERFPSHVWDAVTVGKVLADLHVAFENKLGRAQGLLWPAMDRGGRFYVLNRTSDVLKVARALYLDLVRLAEIEAEVRANGRATDFMGSPLYECPAVATGQIPGAE
jgi:hypothetical protein